METTMRCAQCGAPISPGATDGRCPRCLARQRMKSAGVDTVASKTHPSRVSPFEYESGDVPVLNEAKDRYTHVGEFGAGGMGKVLLVHDEHLGRDVALKELLPEAIYDEKGAPTPARHSKEMAERFLREAKITGQLEHSSITTVYELGRRADGRLYYTMKIVRGKPLSEAIKEAKTPDDRLMLLPHFVNLCNAIAYAHSKGVIHRDIKPSNVLVGDFGETVVIDWGLAKLRDPPAESSGADPAERTSAATRRLAPQSGSHPEDATRTVYGATIGTPAYMPPEQATGQLELIDERSDVYSLGAVLYEILTGRLPFDGATMQEVLAKVVSDPPPRVRELEPKAPKELVRICEECLRKDHTQRPAAAAIVARRVEGYQPNHPWANPFRLFPDDVVPDLKRIPQITQQVIVEEAKARRIRSREQRLLVIRPGGIWLCAVIVMTALWGAFFVGMIQFRDAYIATREELSNMIAVSQNTNTPLAEFGYKVWPNWLFERPGNIEIYTDFVILGSVLLLIVLYYGSWGILASRSRRRLAPYVREVIAEWDVLGKLDRGALPKKTGEAAFLIAPAAGLILGGLIGAMFSKITGGSGFIAIPVAAATGFLVVAVASRVRWVRNMRARYGAHTPDAKD